MILIMQSIRDNEGTWFSAIPRDIVRMIDAYLTTGRVGATSVRDVKMSLVDYDIASMGDNSIVVIQKRKECHSDTPDVISSVDIDTSRISVLYTGMLAHGSVFPNSDYVRICGIEGDTYYTYQGQYAHTSKDVNHCDRGLASYTLGMDHAYHYIISCSTPHKIKVAGLLVYATSSCGYIAIVTHREYTYTLTISKASHIIFQRESSAQPYIFADSNGFTVCVPGDGSVRVIKYRVYPGRVYVGTDVM